MKKVTQERIDRVTRDAADKVRQYGHMVMAVFPDTESDPPMPGFSYTAGLVTTYSHPEVIVFGLPPEVAHQLLNAVAARIKNGELRIEDGMRDDKTLIGMSVVFRAVPPEQVRGHLNMARALQDDVRAFQMIWPDAAGRFAWDSGFDEKYRDAQPLLFMRAAH